MFRCTIINLNVWMQRLYPIFRYTILHLIASLHHFTSYDHMTHFTEHCSDAPFYIQTLHCSVLMHHFTSKCLETQFYITLFECTLFYPNVEMHDFTS